MSKTYKQLFLQQCMIISSAMEYFCKRHIDFNLNFQFAADFCPFSSLHFRESGTLATKVITLLVDKQACASNHFLCTISIRVSLLVFGLSKKLCKITRESLYNYVTFLDCKVHKGIYRSQMNCNTPTCNSGV